MTAPLRFPFDTSPPEGEAIEVAPGVLWLRLPLPMKLDHVNVYALDDGEGWTVIDTGFHSKRMRTTWETILQGPLGGKPITRVIATHHHPDHVGMVGWLQARGAAFWTTRTSWLFARMLTLDEQSQWPAETVEFYKSAGMAPDFLKERTSERPFNYADIVHAMPLGFTAVIEGDVLRAGGRDWDVRLGNGHAPDHITLWSRDDDLVIAGDQILPGISPNIGVYATEPQADPLAGWLAACDRFAALAEDRHLVLPGHQRPFTGLPARMAQLIENHHSALDRLRQHLAQPQTAADCFKPLFKRQITGGEYGLALVEAVAHLNHLWHRGELNRTRRDDGALVYSLTSAETAPVAAPQENAS
ncbi:MAG: MBL fold metallo-hydrolase [Pseudomonadota bacterium]